MRHDMDASGEDTDWGVYNASVISVGNQAERWREKTQLASCYVRLGMCRPNVNGVG